MRTPKQAAKFVANNKGHSLTWTLIYTGSLAAVLTPEFIAIHGHHPTISSTGRWLFRTNTRAGRTIWLGVFGLWSFMLAGHIMGANETEWR